MNTQLKRERTSLTADMEKGLGVWVHQSSHNIPLAKAYSWARP
jgi:hypothetical protein